MQIENDNELLALMLEDMRVADRLYRPTNYWQNYENKLIPALTTSGLASFRSDKNSVFESLGGADLLPKITFDLFKFRILGNRFSRKIPLWGKIVEGANIVLGKFLARAANYSVSIDDIRYLSFEFARLFGETNKAKSLKDLDVSDNGKPEDIFTIGENKYTLTLLKYYLCYAYCCKFVNFDDVKLLAELGSGSGKQVEVIRKLHPDVCFFLFDIPPQLYVAEQYLKSIFGSDVVSYRETRGMQSLPKATPGKIYLFSSSKMALLEHSSIDLFWNEASFQEMKPDVVSNYLRFVNSSAKRAFLCQVMHGKEIALREGEHGVLKQTKLEHYKEGLPNLVMRDMSPFWHLPKFRTLQFYSYSFWDTK